MDTKQVTNDVKNEIGHTLEKLAMLRDEVKLHLHLASLDIKQEWDEKFEPKIDEAQRTAAQVGESSRSAVEELVGKVEGFVTKLRNQVGEVTSQAVKNINKKPS